MEHDVRRVPTARRVPGAPVHRDPDRPKSDFIEFDSMINVRPAQGNRSRDVEDARVRRQIEDLVERLVAQ